MQFVIEENENGVMLRDFLRRHLKLSSKMLKYLKYREDGILVNGNRVTVRFFLHTGDVLTLATTDSEPPEHLTPVNLPLEILYEDKDLVVPSKPADMPTHPSHGHAEDTVANALAYRYEQMGIPFVFRPINRLDRNTSGLLLVARNKMAACTLTDAMQEGRIRKTYLAVLVGEDLPDSGVIEKPLHRTADSIIVREVCSPDTPDAEPAKTLYRCLARENGCALVEAQPVTGRTHQIRVHFASIGHPLVGDDLYGSTDFRLKRHALHARSLSFPHPVTNEALTFTAPFPPDFDGLIRTVFPIWSATEKEGI